jgi:4-amino-4-deoxy-L-arabinose transferase-like glycosyltransferase
MTPNFLFTTILLFTLLVGIDAGLYFLRLKRNNAIKVKLQNILERTGKGIVNRLKSILPEKTGFSGNPEHPIKEEGPATLVETALDINSVHVQVSAQIPPNSTVHITLEVEDDQGGHISQKRVLIASIPEPVRNLEDHKIEGEPETSQEHPVENAGRYGVPQLTGFTTLQNKLDKMLLIAALAVYAFVVGFGIDRYPIYFFTDEAIHMNMASDFIRDHFRNYYHEFLPAFFSIEGWVNGTSVYLQVIPFLLFGKSIVVTRLVSAAVTLAGALALGLLLKQVFRIKYSWAVVFLLLTTPAWFLHARTAFEYAEVASFYCIFLYYYCRYRDGDLRSLYAAIFAGALTFYTHGLGQVLMGVTGLALALIDLPYHLHPQRRRTVLLGLGLAVLLLLPFVRYYLAHSGESLSQIKRRGSYWTNDNLTVLQKMWEFIQQYAYGLNPFYWYFQNTVDIDRHIMKGYGNGLWFTLPFAVTGFVKAVRNFRQFPYRVALIAFFAAPLPASIVAIGMPRMLWMSVPLAIFTTLGISICLEWLEKRRRTFASRIPATLFAVLTILSIFMLADALINGPTWFQDYGLYGMQYGAKQVFQDTIVPDLKNDPDLVYIVSPSWANGTEKFIDFFVPDSLRSRVNFGQPINEVYSLASITSDANVIVTTEGQQKIVHFAANSVTFTLNLRFVVTSNEYDQLLKDPKFKDIVIHKVIPYPNAQPGFYVISLNTADNIGAILAAEKTKNRIPVPDSIQLNGRQIRVYHSPFGSGDLKAIFDDNPDTLAHVLEANPFTFDLYPEAPLEIHGAVVQTGSLPNFTITFSLYAPGAAVPVIYTGTYKDLPSDPLVTMNFDKGPTLAARIYIQIKDNLTGDSSQIHVRTIEFK